MALIIVSQKHMKTKEKAPYRPTRILAILTSFMVLCACGTDSEKQDIIRNIVTVNLAKNELAFIPNYMNVFYITSHANKVHAEALLSKKAGVSVKDHICTIDISKDIDSNYLEVEACMDRFYHQLQRKGLKIHHLVNSGNDLAVFEGAKLRSKYGIAGLSADDAERFYDKSTMKNLASASLGSESTAKYTLINQKDIVPGSERQFFQDTIYSTFSDNWSSLVLKPTQSTSSRSVKVFSNGPNALDEMVAFYKSDLSKETGNLLIEEFIEGEILRLDGYIESGKILANFTSLYHVSPKDFYQDGIPQLTEMIHDSEEQAHFANYTQNLLKAFQYEDGVYHLELIKRKQDDKLFFLEIAARPGGTLSSTLTLLGYNPTASHIYSQLDLKQHELKTCSKSFATVTMEFPQKLNATEVWLKELSDPDLSEFQTLQHQLSWRSSTNKKLRASYRPLQMVFIDDNHEAVIEEATRLYFQLNARFKVKGGPNDGQWYTLQGGPQATDTPMFANR